MQSEPCFFWSLFLLMATIYPAWKWPAAFGREQIHSGAKEVDQTYPEDFWSKFPSTHNLKLGSLVAYCSIFHFLSKSLWHPDSSTAHLNPFLSLPSFLPFFFPSSVRAQHPISTPHNTDQIIWSLQRFVYIKTNLLFGEPLYILFYLFSTTWGESWQTVNLILSWCQQIYFRS